MPVVGVLAESCSLVRYMGPNTYGLRRGRCSTPSAGSSRRCANLSRAAEKRVGFSGAQFFVLHALEEAPGLSLNDLAERTRTASELRLGRGGAADPRTAG